MTAIETFNSSDVDEIASFASKVAKADEKTVSNELIAFNIKKSVTCLKQLKEDEYKGDKCEQLLRLLRNLSDLVKSLAVIDELIKLNIHSLFIRMLSYYLKLGELNSNYEDKRKESIAKIFNTLIILTSKSDAFSNENIKSNIVKLPLDVLSQGGLLTDNDLNSDVFLDLYDKLIGFLLIFVKNSVMIETLLSANAVQILLRFNDDLNVSLNRNKKTKELKIIKADLVTVIAFLLNEKELDTLFVTQEIVEALTEILIEAISQKNFNGVKQNTKFYFSYKIGNTNAYMFAIRVINRMLKVSINDTVKQKLYDNGGLVPITKLFEEGNEEEQEKTSELICLLCFNDDIIRQIREEKTTINLIQIKANNSKNTVTKLSCRQIVEMVNQTLDYRISSARPTDELKSKWQVMISYNTKFQLQCLKLNEELKKKGYRTWINAEHKNMDLHDVLSKVIANAGVILICYSETYKLSNSNRLEADYANRHEKNIVGIRVEPNFVPTGWLAQLLGGKQFVDFSHRDADMNISYSNLFYVIDSFLSLNSRPNTVVGNTSKQQLNDSILAIEAPPTTLDLLDTTRSEHHIHNPEKWSAEQVRNWLISSDLKELSSVFDSFDGLELSSLREMKKSDYGRFSALVDKEITRSKIEIPLRKLLRFYKLLDELFVD